MKSITVKTPQGFRHHGDIGKKGDDLVFRRLVNSTKDKMRIFDAYSIHPDAYEQIKQEGVKALYYVEDSTNNLMLSLEDLGKMLSGEIKDKTRMLAWTGEFSGGKTIYIKKIAFNRAWEKLEEAKVVSDKNIPQEAETSVKQMKLI